MAAQGQLLQGVDQVAAVTPFLGQGQVLMARAPAFLPASRSSHFSPALQRQPGLAVEPVPFDGDGAAHGEVADHAGALELEAGLLDDPARGDVGHPAARIDARDPFTGTKRHVDQRMGGFGGITPVPVGFAQPVTHFQNGIVGWVGLQRAATKEFAVVRFGDGIDALGKVSFSAGISFDEDGRGRFLLDSSIFFLDPFADFDCSCGTSPAGPSGDSYFLCSGSACTFGSGGGMSSRISDSSINLLHRFGLACISDGTENLSKRKSLKLATICPGYGSARTNCWNAIWAKSK